MKHNFEIIFNPSSINISQLGSITGEIYWKIDEYYFPDNEWSDFPVVIVGWWLSNYVSSEKFKKPAKLRWMDGPYYAVAQEATKPNVHISCINGHDDSIDCEFFVKKDIFVENIIQVATAVYDRCATYGGNDIALIKRYLDSIS